MKRLERIARAEGNAQKTIPQQIMFKILARLNKWLLPSFSKKELDLSKAKKWQKAVLAWKYYVTTRALD